MSEEPAHALLAGAAVYALRATRPVRPSLLTRPTPCRGWDLRTLLRHLNDSLAALLQGLDAGRVGRDGAPEGAADAADPTRALRARLLQVPFAVRTGPATVDGYPLAAADLALAGALELAVHGWDIAQAAGHPLDVPARLAGPLLTGALHLVPPPSLRAPLFGPPLRVPDGSGDGEMLVAFLGRRPGDVTPGTTCPAGARG